MNEPKKREFRREVHRLLRTEGKRFAFGETQGMGGAGARGEVSLHKIFYKLYLRIQDLTETWTDRVPGWAGVRAALNIICPDWNQY